MKVSYREALRFSVDLEKRPGLQSELQGGLNELLTAVVEIGRSQGANFSVQELGEYLARHLFPDEICEIDPLNRISAGMLHRVKIEDPNNRMFKTMSVGSLDGGLSPEVQAAVDAARHKRQ